MLNSEFCLLIFMPCCISKFIIFKAMEGDLKMQNSFVPLCLCAYDFTK